MWGSQQQPNPYFKTKYLTSFSFYCCIIIEIIVKDLCHELTSFSLNINSALLISKHYAIAMGFALVEYMVEITLFPQWKEIWFISNCGLVMLLIGEVIRKAAIMTAGRAFTHLIRIYYEEQHELITHGVYRYSVVVSFTLVYYYLAWYSAVIRSNLQICISC